MGYASELNHFRIRAKKICKAKTLKDVAALIQTPLHQLQLTAIQPDYHVFTIPKPNGTHRLIESPQGLLKMVQKELNRYLQPVYYFEKTTAAYGFVNCPENDPATRNIVTNAKRHLNKKYLLNADLKDFFHQVTEPRVNDIFSNRPFVFNDETAEQLVKLVTFNGRLPMGSPASPALSNFAAIGFDNELLEYVKRHCIDYTRYADDLSFSCNEKLPASFLKDVEEILNSHRFTLNMEKIKTFGPGDEKSVTGIILTKILELPHDFFDQLAADIQRFKSIIEVHTAMHDEQANPEWITKFRQSIEGKINFTGMVYGYGSEKYVYFFNRFNEAFDIAGYLESRSWLEIGYTSIF